MDSLDVMILGANRYQFEDSKTKREVKGCTVHYVQLAQADNDNIVGLIPAKATLPFEAFATFFEGHQFPITGLARIQFDLANKKNPIKVTGFEFIEPVVM